MKPKKLDEAGMYRLLQEIHKKEGNLPSWIRITWPKGTSLWSYHKHNDQAYHEDWESISGKLLVCVGYPLSGDSQPRTMHVDVGHNKIHREIGEVEVPYDLLLLFDVKVEAAYSRQKNQEET